MELLLLLVTYPLLTLSICPFLDKGNQGTPPSGHAPVPESDAYNEALSSLDLDSVINDLRELMYDSHECWPADEFNSVSSYGPLFIRLAWHCSGSYRATDGAGGCGGGRQRFWPEASWEDNTNLDKARSLIATIKDKYGIGLSWGDLMIFAGTAAILEMGGPINEICAGRIDSANGALSEPLGPGNQAPPCPTPGDCPPPLGVATIGLIYVDAEGVLGEPIPQRSAEQIRDVFSRMDMDDRETVALIGGGHAFGKCHGACPNGAGLPPSEAPYDPWPGLCGTGKGSDTFTSGIEGDWTSNPLAWDNEFFNLLLNDEYVVGKGPGDKWQWTNQRNKDLMMLTTDLALVEDENYKQIVEEYACNIDSLNEVFASAWAKLTTNGGQWAENRFCIDYSKSYKKPNRWKYLF